MLYNVLVVFASIANPSIMESIYKFQVIILAESTMNHTQNKHIWSKNRSVCRSRPEAQHLNCLSTW